MSCIYSYEYCIEFFLCIPLIVHELMIQIGIHEFLWIHDKNIDDQLIKIFVGDTYENI